MSDTAPDWRKALQPQAPPAKKGVKRLNKQQPPDWRSALSPAPPPPLAEQGKSDAPPEGYVANLVDEAKSVPVGVASLFAAPKSKEEKVEALAPGILPATRLVKGELGSRAELIGQSVDQLKSAKNIRVEDGDVLNATNKAAQELRAYLSFLSALMPVPGVGAIVSKLNNTIDRGDVKGAFGQASVDIPLLLLGLKSSKTITGPAYDLAKKATDKITEKFKPVGVDIAGKKVPMLQSEAHPETKVGQYTEETKQRGVAARKFKAVEQNQQAAVKEVIRNTARETSDFIGPMQFEPGPAMGDAATAVFKAAKPMYKAMDDSLVSVPKDWSEASDLLNTAIKRAQRLGVNIDIEPAEETVSAIVDKDGNMIDRQDVSGARIDEGLASGEFHKADISLNKTPLQDLQAVRSQLLDMQRDAWRVGDINKARLIGNEVKAMNADAEKALGGTDLYKNWKEADRLWSKGYVLSEISDVLNASTKGTPQGVITDPNISQVPTEIQGASLVSRLNALAESGTLDRGLTPKEITNLRTAAYIIDRSQAVRAGTSSGETASRSRAMTHLLSGGAGPVAGGLTGGAIGLAFGEPLRGMEAGVFLGFVGQVVSRRMLAQAMTTLDGVNALRAMSTAKTATAMTIAMRRLIVAARSAAPNKPQKKEEPKKEDKTTQASQSQLMPTHVFNEQSGEIEPIAA